MLCAGVGGAIGAFYEIDAETSITFLSNVMEPARQPLLLDIWPGRPDVPQERTLLPVLSRRQADGAGVYRDRIFETFHSFARANRRKGLPLIIAGGCDLSCDWNTKWAETGLLPQVFVPPVANDSGSAIGTAIDAHLWITGDAKIEWNVYCGLDFETGKAFEIDRLPHRRGSTHIVADFLANDFILA